MHHVSVFTWRDGGGRRGESRGERRWNSLLPEGAVINSQGCNGRAVRLLLLGYSLHFGS